jgi:hypothetical protein
VSRYAAIPLIVALSPGHSDITRFPTWSPVATGNRLDRAEKILNIAQTTGTVQAFRDPLREVLSYVEIFLSDHPSRSREMPSCSAIHLA